MTPDPFNVIFGAGTLADTSSCVFISTNDDNNFEADHDFTVSIESTTPSITIGVPSSLTATLIDNEGMSKVLISEHCLEAAQYCQFELRIRFSEVVDCFCNQVDNKGLVVIYTRIPLLMRVGS